MSQMPERLSRRILVIDDNREIHEDFRKIFYSSGVDSRAVFDSEAALFGEPTVDAAEPRFELDFASQGAEGLALMCKAREQNAPYALAFVDMRMPPGWDGLETTARLWDVDPSVQVVICTAYSDHSWDDVRRKLGHCDRLVVLKKPFDNIEVLQLAGMLTEKWHLAQINQLRIAALEKQLEQRTRELAALLGESGPSQPRPLRVDRK